MNNLNNDELHSKDVHVSVGAGRPQILPQNSCGELAGRYGARITEVRVMAND